MGRPKSSSQRGRRKPSGTARPNVNPGYNPFVLHPTVEIGLSTCQEIPGQSDRSKRASVRRLKVTKFPPHKEIAA